ncbi:MAG TPA: protein kinase [Ktedonobacterales bacterium]|nr:protein kinase [Ktedonobacterales bacterium]
MEAQVQCPKCGANAPNGARFCPACGSSLVAARPRMSTGLLPSLHMLAKRYAIIRKIAQGGQSAVYLGHDSYQHDAERAIKEMSESQLEPEKRQQAINDFIRESRMLQTLDHPALAHVYDFLFEEGKYYLVMEYVQGHNLEDELVQYRREALDWEDVTRWGVALADTLNYLHSRKPPIIYRDLKPANVMLMPDGNIKLIDFGIARWLLPARMTDTMQLGTDGYAPLEQYSSRSEPRSDVYALGASLYHLLTGRVPEAAPLRMAGHSLKSIREFNPRTPEVVERVILKALSLQPQDRFASAEALGEALEWARRQSQSRVGAARGAPTGAPTGAQASAVAGRGWATGAPPTASGSAHTARSPYSMQPAAGSIASRRTGMPALPPRLAVSPIRMDAGYILVNQTVTHPLEVANRGGGTLTGRTETNISALTVEPQKFTESSSPLTVRINATGLAIGPYVCHIAVRSNGGDQIVQVRFVVRPADDLTGRHRATGY